jgi:alkylation response protein AidB-like acyl-CoA dehydrogenase
VVDDDLRADLRQVVRQVLDDHAPVDQARRLAATPDGFDPTLWARMADAGWTGLEVEEGLGGSGASFRELAVVLEGLGRQLAGGPFLASVVLATGALRHAGSTSQQARWLPSLAGGEVLATVALGGSATSSDPTRIDVRATPVGDGFELDGTAELVPDPHLAALMLVLAEGADGPTLFAVDAARAGIDVSLTPLRDPTRRFGTVSFTGVSCTCEDAVGPVSGGSVVAAWLRDRAAVALACDSLGGAERAMEITVEYARERQQFGRAIGSFQAVKHHCTNMLVSVETARVAAEAAARDLAADAGGGRHWPAIAKAHCADGYAEVAELGIQVHGGIGYTWEHDLHLYLKRAKANQALYGSSAWHYDRLAGLVLGPPDPVPS